jgi:hypothetical protein
MQALQRQRWVWRLGEEKSNRITDSCFDVCSWVCVVALGQICAGLADEAEDMDAAMDVEGDGPGNSSYASAAEAVMGVAIW